MYLQYLITQPWTVHSIYNTALGSQEFVCSTKCVLYRGCQDLGLLSQR